MAKPHRSKLSLLVIILGLFINIATPKPQSVASQTIVLAQQSESCYADTANGILTGLVTDANTQQPISNILVRLYRRFNRNTEIYSIYDAVTDGAGRYIFHDVKQDLYRISLSNSPLYASEWYSHTTNQFAALPVLVKAGVTTTIDTALEPGGTITGRVTAKDTGLGLPNRVIAANRADRLYGEYQVASTDTNGYYTTTRIHSGHYKMGTRSLSGPSGTYGNYIQTLTGNTHDFEAATITTLRSGSVVTDVNIQAIRADALIYGDLHDAATGDLTDRLYATVYAVPLSSDKQTAYPAIMGLVSGGTYSITVTSGSYKVFLSPQQDASYPDYADIYVGGKSSFAEAEVIDVPNSLAQVRRDISLTVSGGFTITVLDAVTQQPITILNDLYVASLESQHAALFPEHNFGPGTGFPLFNGQAFRFRLRTDKYAVTLGAPGYASKTINVQVNAPRQRDVGTVMLTPCSQLPALPDPNTLTHKMHLPALRMPAPTTLNLNAQ